MANGVDKETDAILAFLLTFNLSHPILALSDLSDGSALFEVLQVVDANYFRQPARPSNQPDNWVLKLSSLKRLYRLMTQYYADVLHQPTMNLDVPDLSAIAKDHDPSSTMTLCRLVIAITVQSKRNKEIIDKIQGLSETDQHYIMKAIEQVMSKLSPSDGDGSTGEVNMTDDDHYYQIQTERSRILYEKETLEKVYQSLLEEHRILQTNYDDATAEKDDALSRLRETTREMQNRRNEKADVILRAEIDRLRSDLQTSENDLGIAELELEKHESEAAELRKKVDELQSKADEASRLKDQLDEYRHAADKLQKTENVMEKYKKKLEESADLRKRVKALEEQNAALVDKNASLEEENHKIAGFRPLMESYRSQIVELEDNLSARNTEIDSLKFEFEQCQSKLVAAAEERNQDRETLELYQERVRELEMLSARSVGQTPSQRDSEGNMTEMTEAELMGNDDDNDEGLGLGGELDDAITGTTTTDLKLQIRKLKRELEAAQTNRADTSRILVLENLLEDANRMKSRYEADYLAAHREKLVLQRDLEDIRSGKALGDGAEAAIALRQRLNETVEQLDAWMKDHAELEVKFEKQSKELTVAKSDLNLVNRDQLDILASLRESVNEDKAALERDMEKLQTQMKELSDKNKMQLEQINALLLEKVSLQSESIGQRERMLARERNFSDLKASINGKDIPEEVKARLLILHEENIQVKEQLKTTQEKLSKARTFIKDQDKLFKEEQLRSNAGSPAVLEELGIVAKSQLKIKEEEIERLKRLIQELNGIYAKEQELMLGVIHDLGKERVKDEWGNSLRRQQLMPSSWLGQQRLTTGQVLRR